MRITKTANEITVKAYAGTTGVLLAFDVTNKRREGLLGFALERLTPKATQWEWMTGMLNFPGQPHVPGAPIPTNIAPIQKFRWSDYAVWPESEYQYRVHAAYATNGDLRKLKLIKGPTVKVCTACADEDGVHNVIFNRAAGTSQAFARKFPKAVALIEDKRKNGGIQELTVDELDMVSPGAKSWLSRGALEEILSVIETAKDKTWALDIAIYEYEWHDIVDAVNAAAKRGVHMRLIYHAKEGDKQTKENELNAEPLIKANAATGRTTSKIFHDKFIVLSKASEGVSGTVDRTPVTVLCGSTNFTENGLFRQANVVHVVRTPKGEKCNPTAESYKKIFEELWKDAEHPSKTKQWIDANNPMDIKATLFAGFSPRSGEKDLDVFVDLIKAAKSSVFFATAFVLPQKIVDAIKGKPNDPILRIGVQNKDDNSIAGYHRDRTAQFAATAFLDQGLEGWLKETKTGGYGNILIHTKVVIVDFTTEAPVIISGSHNLSKPASGGNDENYLIIQNNTDVADSYGIELMRVYDHYRFRWFMQQSQKTKVSQPPALTANNSWTDRYFTKDTLHYRDRLRFVGK